MNLGFQSGDAVANKIGEYPDQNSEVQLVIKIRDDGDGELWWAWNDSPGLSGFRMYQVCCGRFWILSPWRTVWRGQVPFVWDQKHKHWRCGQ